MKERSIQVKRRLISTILLAAGLVVMLLLFINLDAIAGTLVPPQALAVHPAPGSHDVEVTTPVSITYNQDMNPVTVNPQTFAVHARQTGWLTETFSVAGGTIMLDPANPFHAGELVQASATTATLSLGGEAPLAPTVWQFNTAPWGGNAVFHENQVFGDNAYSRYAAVGDLDGDDDLDAITVNCNARTRIYENDGTGTLTEVQNFNHITYCMTDAELGDLDGDGDLDALLVDSSEPGLNLTLLNDGTDHFTEGVQLASHYDSYGDLGDLDGDSNLDFFVASGFGTGTLRVWKNDGTGVFKLARDFDTAYYHLDVALGDLDRDGDLDTFTTGLDNSYNKVWLNDGTGAFSETQVIPNANTYGVQLGDLDGDGDLDAYLANTTTSWANLPDEVWLNDGKGHFTDSGQRLDAVNSAYPALGDLDADGDLDVYLAAGVVEGLPDEVWANDGTGIFSLFRTVDENYPGGGATLGDLDGDGNLDAFVFGHNVLPAKGYQVYLNGDWTQAEPMPYLSANAATAQCSDNPDSFYVIGGWGATETPTQTLRYDADTGDWIQLADLPHASADHSAVCYQGKIYLAGGYINSFFHIYDIATNTWTDGPSLPRMEMGAALGAWDGKLYLVGGTDKNEYQGLTPVNQVDVYDIASGVWYADALPHMPVAASFPGFAQAGPYLYLVGGFSGDYDFNVTVTQRLDLSTGEWETGPVFTSARAMFAAAITSQHLYAIGGDLSGGDHLDVTDVVELLDLTDWLNGSWQNLGDPLPEPSQGMTSACTKALLDGEIWSTGGGYIDDYGTPHVYDSNLYHPAELCLGNTFSFDFSPASQAGSGLPGESVIYTLRITNTGNIPDAYSIEITSGWAVTPSAIGPLWPGESADLLVTVAVPPGALMGEEDTAVVTVTSQGDAGQTDGSMLTTTALEAHGVDLTADISALSGFPGQVVTYTLHVTNTGNNTDTILITPAGNLWDVTIPVTNCVLAAGQSMDVVIYVHVDEYVWPGSNDVVIITATSQGDPGEFEQVSLTTTADAQQLYLPVIRK